MSANVPTSEEHAALVARIEALEAQLAAATTHSESPYLTIPEAATLMRCKRGRVDDLLSARRLERVKDGSRTLLRRADVLAYLENGSDRRSR